MIRAFLASLDLISDGGDDSHVSMAWRRDAALRDMRETWHGPRWRSPREIAQMRRPTVRRERGGIRVVGGRQA